VSAYVINQKSAIYIVTADRTSNLTNWTHLGKHAQYKHIHVGRYCDSLRSGRSGDRIPAWKRVSAPVQTGPGAHPASCTMGTGSFPGLKRPGLGVDHPHQTGAEVKERVELGLRGLF